MKVSGPYIEYARHKCGVLVSEKVNPNTDKIKARMDEVREHNDTAVCAHCQGQHP
ncbi:MAG: hypothetical protein GOVbin2937_12 [Prokaryotic dsDNA virus sp.]|nr:MAG: hypothetical protein GOVbin2937_12 [Prokaryotic dsDNA virus sp.]